jgi:hypothetical protein
MSFLCGSRRAFGVSRKIVAWAGESLEFAKILCFSRQITENAGVFCNRSAAFA